MIRAIRSLGLLGWLCISLFVLPATLVVVTLNDVLEGRTVIAVAIPVK